MSEANTQSSAASADLAGAIAPGKKLPADRDASFAGRWQVPLFLMGAATFAFGLTQLFAQPRQLDFEHQKVLVAKLRAAGALVRANAYIMNQLGKPGRSRPERAELQRLLAGTIYQAESDLAHHRPQNARAIISHFESAQELGADLDANDWTALGDARRWIGDNKSAKDAYRKALQASENAPGRVRREFVELQLADDTELSPEGLSVLEGIIAKSSSGPAEYLWALERLVEWHLGRGDSRTALELAEEAHGKLAGSADQLAAIYLEALALREEGSEDSRMKAEALLRSLRDQWQWRDELWAKSGWLLGRLQQEDHRPQAGLAFHEEVLQAVPQGPVHDACQLGQAECMAALERYADALQLFRELGRRVTAAGHRYIDRVAMQQTVATIGESLLASGSLDLAEQYLQLALDWTTPVDDERRAYLLSRIGSVLQKKGDSLMVKSRAAEGAMPAEAKAFFARAAEIQLSQAELAKDDEDSLARSIEEVFCSLKAAGQTHRIIEVLEEYVSRHPTGTWRAGALFELGRAYQSSGRFDRAVEAFQEVAHTYRRMPEALRSMVPLAECLLAMGGSNGVRGAEVLEGIVDDRGSEQLFSPSALEYREALFRLADYYSNADAVPDHFEKAIVRWEDALALYPDDSRSVKSRFALAEAYRKSAANLLKEKSEAPRHGDIVREAGRRRTRALEEYGRVIEALAPVDSSTLTMLEASQLRASYLYRADCLFDLEQWPEAVQAYQEAAWRYENEPTAVTATIQAAHANQRLGKTVEATAALARVRWLLVKIPAGAFVASLGMSPKSYWESMVDRLERDGLN